MAPARRLTDRRHPSAPRPELERRLKHGDTALHRVAAAGDPAEAERLIAAGADLEARDRRGRTALHYAAQRNGAPMVELLLASGADHRARDENRETAVQRAAHDNPRVAVIETLSPPARRSANRRAPEGTRCTSRSWAGPTAR